MQSWLDSLPVSPCCISFLSVDPVPVQKTNGLSDDDLLGLTQRSVSHIMLMLILVLAVK